jgi:hypothetical protein
MSAIAPSQPLPRFRLNVEEAFRFVVRDRDWPAKLGLGALFRFLSFTIIGYVLAQGYLLAFTERVARAEPLPLPEWDDWGQLLRKGLVATAFHLIYALPLLLVLFLIFGGYIALLVALAATSPSGSSDLSAAAVWAITLLALAGYGLFFLFAIAFTVLFPAAHAQLVLHHGDLGAVFRFREILGFIGRYRGQYAVAVLLYFAASTALSYLGYLLCCIGLFVTTFYCQLFLYHMVGQLCWHERRVEG